MPESWRVGSKVPLNVYDENDRPVCQCHYEADALLIVGAVNALLNALRAAPEVKPIDRLLLPEQLLKLKDSICPDCGWLGLLAGPRGGSSRNCTCGNPKCGSRFN